MARRPLAAGMQTERDSRVQCTFENARSPGVCGLHAGANPSNASVTMFRSTRIKLTSVLGQGGQGAFDCQLRRTTALACSTFVRSLHLPSGLFVLDHKVHASVQRGQEYVLFVSVPGRVRVTIS